MSDRDTAALETAVGIAMSKIAVSLPEERIASARQAVKRKRATSVSAYVADAMRAKISTDDLGRIIDKIHCQTLKNAQLSRRRRAG
jgi:Arc/MetJ-type ribon-helix-helix transcriptional regulator